MLQDEIGTEKRPLVEHVSLRTVDATQPQLVVLAAGRGSRFGDEPKVCSLVEGFPLAAYTLSAFACVSTNPPLCVVGYRSEAVMHSLGSANRYVISGNPTGGTAWAACEAVSQPEILEADPLAVIVMGDRIVPPEVFRRVIDIHRRDSNDLTFLSLAVPADRRHGRGRVVISADGRARIVEQRDIDLVADAAERARLEATAVVNCPLYVVRARTAFDELRHLDRANAQGQYYLTDLVARIAAHGGKVATETLDDSDPSYELLSLDVTTPADIESIGRAVRASGFREALAAAALIRRERPPGQSRAIGIQLLELAALGLDPAREISVGIAGGRLRIAFMHPDMIRFYGPAWQAPIGSSDPRDRHQIVVVLQRRQDGQIALSAMNPVYRDDSAMLPGNLPSAFPGPEVTDAYAYESFGTELSRQVLLLLGYADEALSSGDASARLVSSNLRRPFPLLMNALASFRTLARLEQGHRLESLLLPAFSGLSVIIDGDIPRGGFSSSSAVTVATVNALNALLGLNLPDEEVVRISCQAEYGTGVRAGSLDQATAQMGSASRAAVISSNPRDGYRVLARFPVPTDRIRILFPFSVDRDREAWRWSGGAFGPDGSTPVLTTGEYRKLTGKSAEAAALLLRLPLTDDLFKVVEKDLLETGSLSAETDAAVRNLLLRLPSRIRREELGAAFREREPWLAEQLASGSRDGVEAAQRARRQVAALLDGWREPVLQGQPGVPLRPMVAYLFAEVAKCFHLVHHPEDWIQTVSRSQAGDRWLTIEPLGLPSASLMTKSFTWERNLHGPALMEQWLKRHGAVAHDVDADIEDESLCTSDAAPPRMWRGTSFFRGLALLDLAEAMLKRAFGPDAVALRVNAAGQGDYFQVHVDTRRADPEDVKIFLREAVYRRFGLSAGDAFVEVHPGGSAVGFLLEQAWKLPLLARLLAVA